MMPRATYRLQLHKAFTFDDAAAAVPHLAALGISHVYSSPILKARAGSRHCYDMVDPALVNSELGGEEGLRRLVAALRSHGMGLVVDIVPNHMGVGGDENPYWLDVLRHGRASRFADMFDIDWEAGGGRLLLPFLGAPYADALAAGDLVLVRADAGGWGVRHFQHLFPIRPQDAHALDAGTDAAQAGAPSARTAGLHALLERQHYRLADWRCAGDAINWRRFFDVTELAALRADAPGVFERTHGTLLALYAQGLIDGFRVDHVDGLADPQAYCARLRNELSAREMARPDGLRERAWLVVEKILADGEPLPPDWPVDGTTGYDVMEDMSRLLHAPNGLDLLATHWAARTGRPAIFGPEEREARREIIARAFTAQLEGVVDALEPLARLDLRDRDRPRAGLRRSLIEIIAHFPRYRSYAAGAHPTGSEALQAALEGARRTCLRGDLWHLDRIAAWLSPPEADTPDANLRRAAITRFEQLSAPVAAKAVEDTAFYRHGPLLSRNEVGSSPAARGSVDGWHRAAVARARSWPAAMLASATHDHKRGEDARVRLSLLSECPELWTGTLDRWLAMLAGCAPRIEAADRIMLLQTLVGAWPDGDDDLLSFRTRIEGWQVKALREAKRATGWDAPDASYEGEALALTGMILASTHGSALRREIAAFVAELKPAAEAKGLIQTLLKLTAPGVPDIYQGTEYLDLSLVDPDNRRPVDFARRTDSLSRPPQTADARKQHLIRALLRLRAAAPEIFAGAYLPIEVRGPLAMVAFARTAPAGALAAICPIRTFGWIEPNGGLTARAWEEMRLELPQRFEWHPVLPHRDGLRDGLAHTGSGGAWPFALFRGTPRLSP